MKKASRKKDKKAVLKALAGLSINLSAGWLGAFIITPNFSPVTNTEQILILTYDIVFGILFLWIAIKLERMLL